MPSLILKMDNPCRAWANGPVRQIFSVRAAPTEPVLRLRENEETVCRAGSKWGGNYFFLQQQVPKPGLNLGSGTWVLKPRFERLFYFRPEVV